MVDFDKERFWGRTAIHQRRSSGLQQKIVGVAVAPGCDELVYGAKIFDNDQPVGEVVADCFSNTLNHRIGLALLPVGLAYSGLCFRLANAPVRTISMPPILPASLKVKLDEL